MKYIQHIQSPDDVKRLSLEEKKELAVEIRTLLIEKLSLHGGHCGPNLGMVEATIALHSVFRVDDSRLCSKILHGSSLRGAEVCYRCRRASSSSRSFSETPICSQSTVRWYSRSAAS